MTFEPTGADDVDQPGVGVALLRYPLEIGLRASDFCREGTVLTLTPHDDVVAFRRWYLDELIRQVDGGAPTPWPGEDS